LEIGHKIPLLRKRSSITLALMFGRFVSPFKMETFSLVCIGDLFGLDAF